MPSQMLTSREGISLQCLCERLGQRTEFCVVAENSSTSVLKELINLETVKTELVFYENCFLKPKISQ